MIPVHGLAAYIQKLARKHDIAYRLTLDDQMANMITCLADDEVVMDEIQFLLLALRRAGIVSAADYAPMMSAYLQERFGVRPVSVPTP